MEPVANDNGTAPLLPIGTKTIEKNTDCLCGLVTDLLQELNPVETSKLSPDSLKNMVRSVLHTDGPDISAIVKQAAPDTLSTDNQRGQIDDFDLYCTVRQIGDRIYQTALKHGCWLDDRRTESPATVRMQTASGLFIEHYYGSPNKLWTPWGLWTFIGSSAGRWQEVWKEVAEILGATPHTDNAINSMDQFRPVFAITKFGEKPLPKAVELNRRHYVRTETVMAAWEKLTARYQSMES